VGEHRPQPFDQLGVVHAGQRRNNEGIADGAHSTVRTLVGADFAGKTILSSIVLADVKLADGPAGGGLTLGSTRNEFAFLAPYGRRDADGSRYRAMLWDRDNQVPDTQPVDEDEIVGILARAMKADLGLLEVGWKSRFHCDERQVARYRHGRVFLAGDAAHVHSPMGGQGMNTGIQDAANLAWKVDAVLDGADDAVLDSYHDERHPIGTWVLLQSGLTARGVTLHPRVARGLRNLLLPGLLRIPECVTRWQEASRARRCGIPTGSARALWWAPGRRRFRCCKSVSRSFSASPASC
jgi:2-polyprenyl-6-methoxyphenol hydroxylase-like FAD-dependent oxidoreductase